MATWSGRETTFQSGCRSSCCRTYSPRSPPTRLTRARPALQVLRKNRRLRKPPSRLPRRLPRRRPRPHNPAMPAATRAFCATPLRVTRSKARRMARRQSPLTGGGARLRELPWSRSGARRRRCERQHPQIRPGVARTRERVVPRLSQPRHARRMGGQRARIAEPFVHHLPQRPQPNRRRTSW